MPPTPPLSLAVEAFTITLRLRQDLHCGPRALHPSRHDESRDLLVATIGEVAHDVSIEPALTPTSGEPLPPNYANTTDDARVDIAARGFSEM